MPRQGRSERPLLLLAVPFCLGASVGDAVPAAWCAALLALAGALLCAVAVAAERGARLRVLGLCVAAAGIGGAGAGVERQGYERTPLSRLLESGVLPPGPLRLIGTAASDADLESPSLLLDLERIDLRAGALNVLGRARVFVAGRARRWRVEQGDRVELWATLRPPQGTRSPGAFDAAEHAYRRGVHALGVCKSPLLLAATSGRATGPASALAKLRGRARRALLRHLAPGPQQGLVRAMVLGDRAGVDEDVAEAFRIAGTYHVLALSGAQVALVAGLLLLAARKLGLGPGASAVGCALAVSAYAAFAGGDTPVVRAAVMAVVLFLGRGLGLGGDAGNLLGLAALLLLAGSPSSALDPSFQLSFAATLGLVLLSSRFAAAMPTLPRLLALALGASVAAQLALLPLLAVHFHRLSPAALAMNLVAGPLASAVLVAGFLVLAAAAVAPPLAPLAASAAHFAADLLLRSGTLAADATALDVRVPTPGALAVVLLVGGLGAIARSGLRPAALAATGLGVAGHLLGPGAAVDGRLHLAVLDVGQGDALVLTSPRGRVMLVDAGRADGPFDSGEDVVSPYLWALGHRRVESMLLTHGHPDHAGGLPFVGRTFRARWAFEGPGAIDDPSYLRFERSMRALGVPRLSLARGARWDWDGVRLEVLGPRGPAGPPARVRNDHSLVLRVRYGEVSLLLTGDVERVGEDALAPGRVDVLKVAHHGSRSSSGAGFLAGTRPRLAIVSVGGRNPFGHPSPDVLARLHGSGSIVLRTDRHGTVEIATDGGRIWHLDRRAGAERRVR
jgi:competence protein ComEC